MSPQHVHYNKAHQRRVWGGAFTEVGKVGKPGRTPVVAKQIYLLSAVATSTAQATVQPTIGLLPIPSQLLRTVRQSAYGP